MSDAKTPISISRRRVLRVAAGGASIGAGLATSALVLPFLAAGRRVLAASPQGPKVGLSVVGMARDTNVVDGQGRVVASGVDALVERAVASALSAPSAAAGLSRVLSRSDTVGLKINCLAGRGLSTHSEVVDSLIAKLVAAGIAKDRIIVWDRSDRDLTRARYTIKRSGQGPFFYGTNQDYEPNPIEAGSVGGCLSEILTNRVTAIINVPVLKDHDLAGISGALKSFYGAIHNPNKYHDHGCAPYIADLYAHPAIRGKVKLTVFDALYPQAHGGPAYVPEHAYPYGAIFASVDPVAADATALRLIAARRKEVGLETLERSGRAPTWLSDAATLGLGVMDGERIREVST